MTLSDAIVLAIVTGAFAWGAAWASLQGKVKLAMRIARRAHARIDELEDQTGVHTILREIDAGSGRGA